ANQIGGNDDIIFDGSSFAVNRKGDLIQVLASFETDFAVLEYDAAKQDLVASGNGQDARSTTDLGLGEGRQKLGSIGSGVGSGNGQDARSTTDLSFYPAVGDAEIWAALVLGVRDYVRKCGFSKVVLGLSGGIDSALVAAIASCAI